MDLDEYTSLTPEEARTYCAGSEHQRVRAVMAERVGERTVIDLGCGPGIDAHRYRPDRYLGIDVSPALVKEARRRNPLHRFAQSEMLRGRGIVDLSVFDGQEWRRSLTADVVIIKSVLEHTRSVAYAKRLLIDAIAAAPVVLVAWHTPPRDGPEILRRVVGHFGRDIWQNTYSLADFDDPAIPDSDVEIETVDNFQLWTITRRT